MKGIDSAIKTLEDMLELLEDQKKLTELTVFDNEISEHQTAIKVLNEYKDSLLLLCGGCNVKENWEHRCHGEKCNCKDPICMEKQGKITNDQLMDIINQSKQL